MDDDAFDAEMAAVSAMRRSMISSAFERTARSFAAAAGQFAPYQLTGRVEKVLGTIIHASLPDVRIGEIIELFNRSEQSSLEAECVGFLEQTALLSPIGETLGISARTEVRRTGRIQQVAVGEDLLGRVLNGLGRIIDDQDRPFVAEAQYPLHRDPPQPLSRCLIQHPLSTGIRAIDGLLTCGEGQRIGIFAASGVGKSVLLSMLAKGSAADVVVLALIGERGREVREFIERGLGPEGRKRCVVIVATSDQSAMERARAAFTATAVAEYFRDQGRRVLLMMDSVTRFARALREIGLAAGEPPTRRGYPPSVFATLPRLMERAGMSASGSITALYTVLVEGDDMNEPVADEVRSILDGHIVLSQKLATANHFPAIDILASKSRVMPFITSPEHRHMAGEVRTWMAGFAEIELLLHIGEYQQGSNPEADKAIAKRSEIDRFLRQKEDESEDFDAMLDALRELTR